MLAYALHSPHMKVGNLVDAGIIQFFRLHQANNLNYGRIIEKATQLYLDFNNASPGMAEKFRKDGKAPFGAKVMMHDFYGEEARMLPDDACQRIQTCLQNFLIPRPSRGARVEGLVSASLTFNSLSRLGNGSRFRTPSEHFQYRATIIELRASVFQYRANIFQYRAQNIPLRASIFQYRAQNIPLRASIFQHRVNISQY